MAAISGGMSSSVVSPAGVGAALRLPLARWGTAGSSAGALPARATRPVSTLRGRAALLGRGSSCCWLLACCWGSDGLLRLLARSASGEGLLLVLPAALLLLGLGCELAVCFRFLAWFVLPCSLVPSCVTVREKTSPLRSLVVPWAWLRSNRCSCDCSVLRAALLFADTPAGRAAISSVS
jgi:hypothetical protein